MMEYYGTLGPSCKEFEILKEMFAAGMTGIRLNLSHGNLEENGDWLRVAIKAAGEWNRDLKPQILIDLRGPEVRLGKLDKIWTAEEGVSLILGESGLPVPEILLEEAEVGDHILIDDGKIELQVEEGAEKERAEKEREGKERVGEKRDFSAFTARVLRGGVIKSGKSLALKGKELPMPTLTESDRKNIRMAAEYGVTGVMLPFVRSREDLLTLRQALSEAGTDHIKIFAKIENLQGVREIESLLPYCDHVVIARGDLGNAMPLWKLPGVQKYLAEKCRKAEKPFMVVTQMLDSMHERAVPTRAEVLDIYNAVLDGASSLMLTGETAAGKYPEKAMEYLVRTGEEACRDQSAKEKHF